jgi:hypothetical protein
MRSFAGTRPKLVANAVLSKAVQVFRDLGNAVPLEMIALEQPRARAHIFLLGHMCWHDDWNGNDTSSGYV